MNIRSLFQFRDERMKVLHMTTIAFFLTFVTWFNMAPLATSMIASSGGWLTKDDLAVLAILNVALTVPARVIIGALLDRFGPRRIFTALLVVMSVPTFLFALGSSVIQLAIARLLLSCIGAGFVVGIRMVSEWFPPKSIGFSEGFYAGWGNFGSAAASMTLPWLALTVFGGESGWRIAIALTGVICLVYGVIYYSLVKDTPDGSAYRKPKQSAAMEVGSWGDLVQLVLWTFPLAAVLGLLVWKLGNQHFISHEFGLWSYVILSAIFLYQVVRILQVNVPILKRGVPEDDRYSFRSVAALNTTYFANFGAELAVISMLPMFYQSIFRIGPAEAGLIASSFAFVNLFARPLGGYLSDRFLNRKAVMLIYMAGIAAGFFAMSRITAGWPIMLAVAITILTSMFVQGAEGATFAMIPMVKKRLTGQVAGMAGAYGNVGSVTYLTLLTMMTAQQFFLMLSGGALLSFICCLLLLERPKHAYAEDYPLSSVDRELLGLAAVKRAGPRPAPPVLEEAAGE